jgi:hypothetical protein
MDDGRPTDQPTDARRLTYAAFMVHCRMLCMHGEDQIEEGGGRLMAAIEANASRMRRTLEQERNFCMHVDSAQASSNRSTWGEEAQELHAKPATREGGREGGWTQEAMAANEGAGNTASTAADLQSRLAGHSSKREERPNGVRILHAQGMSNTILYAACSKPRSRRACIPD